MEPRVLLWASGGNTDCRSGDLCFQLKLGFSLSHLLLCPADDGISPERAAQVMGPPDRCQHAAHVINELILTAQVGWLSGVPLCRRQKQEVPQGSWGSAVELSPVAFLEHRGLFSHPPLGPWPAASLYLPVSCLPVFCY